MLGIASTARGAEDSKRHGEAANGRPVAANVAARGARFSRVQSRPAGAWAGSAPPVMGGSGSCAGTGAGCSRGFFSRTR